MNPSVPPKHERTASPAAELRLLALPGIPLVTEGQDIASLILDALIACGETLRDGDLLVIAQKILSKAEGRVVKLATVTPSAQAIALGKETGKEPRLVELILGESDEVLRYRRDVIVVAHRLGFVMANAGIDQSNVGSERKNADALLLPRDPDGSCSALRATLRHRTGADIGVVINDSHGRAWRNGTVGVALGVAGLPALVDLRGCHDLYDRALRITEVGLADELAAAASLLMDQSDEGRPVILARGVPYARREGSVRELLRSRDHDLFR